jgi:predicted enzyme involved in methoxymalonyl-ACP biosynthesis
MENSMQIQPTKNIPLDMNEWSKIIDGWRSGSESQKTYCERLGISLNTFTYARNKLQKKSNLKTQFIPITIKNAPEEKALLSSVIVLENSQGYKLHFPASLSLEQMAKIFKLSGWDNA